MKVIVVALLLVAVAGTGEAAAETADCRAQLKRQDEQCQQLAETLEGVCPGGQNIKDNAECSRISTQIANTCTRKPCAPPPRKGKSKGKSMGKGMGKAKAKAKSPEPKSQ
jgi:hypothetical protein